MLEKVNKAEGCQHLQERFSARPNPSSRLEMCYDPGPSSCLPEIQAGAGNKVVRYQPRGRPRGLPYSRRRKAQHCIAVGNRESETASEPAHRPLSKSRRGAWGAGLAQHPGLEVGPGKPSTSQGRCASASHVAAAFPGCPKDTCHREVPYNLRACTRNRRQEMDEQRAEELGPRKAQAKRKNVQAPAESECLNAPAERGCLNSAEETFQWEEPPRRQLYSLARDYPRRPVKEKINPLKRTYGDTKVNDLLGHYQGPDVPSSEDSDDTWEEGYQRGARPRGRGCKKTLRRPGRRCAVVHLDAQTQTESESCCCKGISQPSTSSQPRGRRPPRRRAGPNPSQSSSSSSEEEEDGGSSQASGSCSTPSSGGCSDGQRPPAKAQCMQLVPVRLPDRDGPGAAPRDRRRFAPTAATQAAACAQPPPRRRRSSSPKAEACQPRRSQDNWGCLIF
ncbi:serine/arginine repetitive matrix protein 1-like [Scyliorhinus canicula]|uniref:serine/arginine repetitive matrix protein 1-like n=1 Tax=Scyliorhinus canicula TaxID=7830 RepID=UPI0018F5C902|nr:serine/arginine repetitive matrix protein 1-like [Scyliorhinus canicula]